MVEDRVRQGTKGEEKQMSQIMDVPYQPRVLELPPKRKTIVYLCPCCGLNQEHDFLPFLGWTCSWCWHPNQELTRKLKY
jgi:hypothetical protein